MSLPSKRFYYIRHGQTDWNLRGITMGQTDVPLNAMGVQQAHTAAELLVGRGIASVVTSPLVRAQQTAQIIAEKLQLPVSVYDNLKEASFGLHEGRDKEDRSWYGRWRQGETHGSESYAAFCERVMHGMHEILNTHLEPALIVAHGGTYWPIQGVLQTDLEHLSNCNIVVHEPPVAQITTSWVIRLM